MYLDRRTLPLFLVPWAAAGAASAQTITVTTSADVVDVGATATLSDLPGPDGVVSLREALRASDNTPGHQTVGFAIPEDDRGLVSDLPGPDGVVSLREALRASDNTPGHQTVGFAIPEDDWYLADIFPGLVLLQGSFSWNAAEPVTIDGTTQTAFTGDTNPDGNEVVIYGLSLYLNGDGSAVTGLDGSRVEVGGSNALIHDNTGGMYIVVYSGSGGMIRDNEADTIKIDRSNGNVVVRNVTRRVRIDGWFGGGQPAANNRIGGPDPADRNFITGWGNYGEHGVPGGTTVELFDTLNTLVQNNYIGTTPDGMAIGNPAARVGIWIKNDNRDLVIRDNLIAARAVGVGPVNGVIYGQAIYLESYDGGDGIHILGNTLGLDAAGEPLLGGVNGIWVSRYALEFAQDVRIGGSAPGEGNVVAGHLSTGVLIENGPGTPQASGIRLSGNSIYVNGEIGIDLMPDTWTFGPTPNDPLDADAGANGLQNYPELASALLEGASIRVVGTLQSSPLDTFTVELFASPDCDPSGFGQARVFLGSAPVSTDAAGAGAFDVLVPALAPAGWVVTATATLEPEGETSELSACTPIGDSGPGVPSCFGDGSGSSCPCGNDSSQPGRGCLTSAGEGMFVTGSGSASIAADDLALTVHDVPAGNTGIFYAGQTAFAGNPLFDGLQCAGGSSLRFRGRFASTSTVGDTGFVAQDPVGGYWVPGATYTFQYFSRDLAAGASPCGGFANLSAAYAVTMAP